MAYVITGKGQGGRTYLHLKRGKRRTVLMLLRIKQFLKFCNEMMQWWTKEMQWFLLSTKLSKVTHWEKAGNWIAKTTFLLIYCT
jgi:hypothetical protein